ncbi:UPF0187-domain-containing protein [Coprinopsis marcescibilis]|uniref:UPF0187-domain-containing protein n=1 Tax=Coprinopsis marcescibilis TaxID=230819 RepID=A0A5C3KXL9_COPMA|nr:UPF0187-domain-containing protein [Coprinopsis marcescibilis]
MPPSGRSSKRSSTGNHVLLPASRPTSAAFEHIPRVPTYSLITWTFGRGSVIWRIWPAVLLHTVFAAAIVTASVRNIVHLEIPNVMLTVLGVVIGFVISYRAMSGYERYWLGRTYWSDIMRNSRTLGRLVWYHVPPRLSGKTPEEVQAEKLLRPVQELNKVMAEKRMALDLIHGYSVALKHHLRGELGIYFEDLYHLIRPLHDHEHTADDDVQQSVSSALPPRKGMRITKQTNLPAQHEGGITHTAVASSPEFSVLASADTVKAGETTQSPPVYGTFGDAGSSEAQLRHSPSLKSVTSNVSSVHQPLLPSTQPPDDELMNRVSSDLIPFARSWKIIKGWFSSSIVAELPIANAGGQEIEQGTGNDAFRVQRQWKGPVQSGLHTKHRPVIAGGGENLPLEIVRCLSEWFSVLEDRGTVPGTSLGGMIATLTALEDSLTCLERILTTPLPFVYSVHISTVWLYLFFLPFQLVSQFQYYTVPGVAIAAFIYLGFVAAGEEIEQPFGYDDNDLDLDLFCSEIIGSDIKHLKVSPGLNVYLAPTIRSHPQTLHRQESTVHAIATTTADASGHEHGHEEEVTLVSHRDLI